MNVLVIGQGGREHAIVKALAQSSSVASVHALPGNKGMAEAQCHSCEASDFESVLKVCQQEDIQLVVVGPENHLALGLGDFLRSHQILVFGPNREGARLEASKVFAKEFMEKYKVPTAPFHRVQSVEDLKGAASHYQAPFVLKADGLAGGKGVFICESLSELLDAGQKLFEDKVFGEAGAQAIIEEFQPGYEISFFFLTNGKGFRALPMAQDHKRLLDGDQGPNTGGMGTVAPVEISSELHQRILDDVVKPTVEGLSQEQFVYNGVVFVGLMVTDQGPKVIEYNIRFGDPETQVLLPLMMGDWGQAFLQVAKGELPEMNWNSDRAMSCVVLAAENYPQSPVKGAVISGSLEDQESGYFLHAGTGLKDGSWVTNGGRVLNALGSGDSLTAAVQKSYAQAKKVSWTGMQMRKDIGKQFYQE